MSKLIGRLRNPARVLLILVAFIVVVAIVIDRDADEFALQTAIGQTNDTLQTSEDFQHLERANQAFIDLVARTRPAVVQITTETKWEQRRQPPSPFRDDFFERFFGPDDSNTEQETIRGLGSGVIVSEDGYILTNNHVIDGVDDITVILSNERKYEAKLVGSDPARRNTGSDLALIKIDAKNLQALQFGDSDALEVGEWVIAIGSPLGFSQSVTRGIVSAKNRAQLPLSGSIPYSDFIQTDAPINRGNSGGALINIRGELVGINALILTGGYSSGNIGLGFAIPSNMAQQLMPDLIKGKVVRGWLGIVMTETGHDLADELQFESPRGVVVTKVFEGSPAEKAGVRPRDIILEFDGETVRGIQQLMHTVAATEVGKPVKLTVLRGGSKEKRLTVKLAERTEEIVDRSERRTLRDEQGDLFAGIRVQGLTPAIADRYGYTSDATGVIVTEVENDSEAQKKGIRPGYLIQEMEWIPVDDFETYANLVKNLREEGKEKVLFYVKSPDGWGRYITVKVSTSDR